MKSYTDIEQSKKLSKILPIKSADFSWRASFNGETNEWKYNFVPTPHYLQSYIGEPCWSLTALLDILPDRTCVYKKTYKNGLVKYQGVMEGNKELLLKDNPIDVCVEMIIKLHELNLL